MSDKCEGCPAHSRVCLISCELADHGFDRFAPQPGDCHLTPSLQRIIRAMMAGEWKCGNCEYGKAEEDGAEHWYGCARIGLSAAPGPCVCWQPRDQFEGLDPIPNMPEPEDLKPCPECGLGQGYVRKNYDRTVCPRCRGTGRDLDSEHEFEGNLFFGQCPKCKGSGKRTHTVFWTKGVPNCCPTCHGTGEVSER